VPLPRVEGEFGLAEEEGAAGAAAGRCLGRRKRSGVAWFGGRMDGGALDGEGTATGPAGRE
jgi:hypothetical protein